MPSSAPHKLTTRRVRRACFQLFGPLTRLGQRSRPFCRYHRGHPWFRQDLPEYLTWPPDVLDAEYTREDQAVVIELSRVRMLAL